MGFESILDKKEPVKGVTRPAFFLDLNIDQILERITKGDRGILEYFEYFPLDAECEGYRHDVYADIKENALYDALLTFNTFYNEFRDIENKKKSTRIDLQRPVWHFWGMEIYTRAITELKCSLENAKLTSEGFKELKILLETYTGTQDFILMSEKAAKLKADLLNLTVYANYENGRIQVTVEDSNENKSGAADSDKDQVSEGNGDKQISGENNDEDEYENIAEYEDFLEQICAVNEKEFVNPFSFFVNEERALPYLTRRIPYTVDNVAGVFQRVHLAIECSILASHHIEQNTILRRGYKWHVLSEILCSESPSVIIARLSLFPLRSTPVLGIEAYEIDTNIERRICLQQPGDLNHHGYPRGSIVGCKDGFMPVVGIGVVICPRTTVPMSAEHYPAIDICAMTSYNITAL